MLGNVAEGASVHIQSGQENRRVVTGNLRVTGSPASSESPTGRLFGNLLALVGSEEARSVAPALASR